jgi:ABC-2 type transport system ATP-binding protein
VVVTPPASAAIAIEDLEVVRGVKTVLPGVSLQVPSGAVTGLLGPSGSGKTTLIRAIAGVQIVAGGTVSVLGEPAGVPSLRQRVGYVTQSPSVYGDLTVRENLSYFARILGAEEERVTAVIERVSLGREADQVVSTLSGGQRSRASLATALLNEPEVLLLDEPTVGLDPVLRVSLWGLFAELAAEGRTLLISSHVMDEAVHCERLLLLREGRIAFDGPPQQLRDDTGSDDLETAFLRLIERDEAER